MEQSKVNLSLLITSLLPFPEPDMSLVLNEFRPQLIPKGKILVAAGNICDKFYFVNEGCLRTYFITSSGQERTRLILPKISIGTALTSFISNTESFELLDALEDTSALSISRDSFYELVDQVEPWRLFYQRILEMAYIFQNRRIEELLTGSASERLERLHHEHPEYLRSVPLRVLASYLDISPETLSRLRSRRT